MEKNVPDNKHLLSSLMTGFFLSAGLSLLFHFGILITYHYFPVSVLFITGLIIVLALLFWVNIKYDHMLDLNDVFSRTISFDMKVRAGFFLRFLRPLTPYVGAFITILVLLLVLWGVPALIIYLVVYPGPPGNLLKVGVFCMSTGICVSYFYYNRDAFPAIADKLLFFAGMLLGTVPVINII